MRSAETKGGVSMKKVIAFVAAFALAAGVFFAGIAVGKYKPGYELEKSSVYSYEDIKECAKLAERELCSGEVKRYPVKIYYSDKWFDYAKSFIGQIDGVSKAENILVVKADYLTGKETQAQEPYSYISDWNFVFSRKDENSPWVLYTQGYA